eukprot:Skav224144  [mRNA]  locus=scaffold462:297070:303258:- [translate_table: standard]
MGGLLGRQASMPAIDASAVKRAPKVELHVHLDGSFDSAVLFRAAQKHLEDAGWASMGNDFATSRTGAFATPAIERFHHGQGHVGRPNDNKPPPGQELSYEFCRGRKEENIIYTEVVVRQILCCIGAQPSWSQLTAELAEKYRAAGVVGAWVELLGHGGSVVAVRGRQRGMKLLKICDASGDNVTQAMDIYGATRIGHGYRSLGTEAYSSAKAKDVHFELCPTSSVSTEAIELPKKDGTLSWATHPITRFVKDRVSCSINSDDPAIFRCSLTDELMICVQQMDMSRCSDDLHWLTMEALRHAFNLEDSLKKALEAKINDFYQK